MLYNVHMEVCKLANFSDRFRKLRKEKEQTLEELAVILNTTKTTLSRYENGKRIPDADFIILASKYFNCTSDYLLGISDLSKPLSEELDDKELTHIMRDVQEKILATRNRIVHFGKPISENEFETLEAMLTLGFQLFIKRVESKKVTNKSDL